MRIKHDKNFVQVCLHENLIAEDCEYKILQAMVDAGLLMSRDENEKELFGCVLYEYIDTICEDEIVKFMSKFQTPSIYYLLDVVLLGNGECQNCGGELDLFDTYELYNSHTIDVLKCENCKEEFNVYC